MKNELRLELPENSGEAAAVADVSSEVPHLAREPDQVKMRWVAHAPERISRNLRAELLKPQREPGSFKAGVAGHKNTFPRIDIIEHGGLLK